MYDPNYVPNDNYYAPDELTVRITLREYRQLVAIATLYNESHGGYEAILTDLELGGDE